MGTPVTGTTPVSAYGAAVSGSKYGPAGSVLIRKYNEAKKLMLTDSTNSNFLEVAERNYQRLDLDTKAGYRLASINIIKVQPVNDSTTIFIYSNSYKNNHDSLKIVKKNNSWLVDLKYLYQHDMDTLIKNIPQSDSLK